MTDQEQVPEQSQSQPGPTNPNPNEDVENGTQSQVQPGGANEPMPGGQPAGGETTSGDQSANK